MSDKPTQEDLQHVTLEHQKCEGTSCKVELVGATISSFKIMGHEMLFVSKKAYCEEEKKPLRGGIPIVFPQFGPGKIKQHGFARLCRWKMPVMPTVNPQTGDVDASFVLVPNDFSKAMWPHDFALVYRVILKHSCLAVQLQVKNTDSEPFTFTSCLHTYFPVDDISKATVKGLKGSSYIDKVDEGKTKVESDDPVMINGRTDRVYTNVKNDIILGDGGNASLLLKSVNFDDIVVWNPWSEIAKSMSDFDDEEYKTMICVEPGATKPIVLAPGETWTGKHGITLLLPDTKL